MTRAAARHLRAVLHLEHAVLAVRPAGLAFRDDRRLGSVGRPRAGVVAGQGVGHHDLVDLVVSARDGALHLRPALVVLDGWPVVAHPDVGRGSEQERLGIQQEPGLSNLIVGSAKASEVVVKTSIDGLWAVPAEGDCLVFAYRQDLFSNRRDGVLKVAIHP